MKTVGIALLISFLLSVNAQSSPRAQQNLGRFENDRDQPDRSRPDAAYGCPGYAYKGQMHPAVKDSGTSAGKGAKGAGKSPCKTAELLNGLESDLQAVQSMTTSLSDKEAAQQLLDEVREAQDANTRLDRFKDEWTSTGPSDQSKAIEAVVNTVRALVSGDFTSAERTAMAAATAPTLLGRGDFPDWYPPERFQRDRTVVEGVDELRSRIWNLASLTLPQYRN